MGRKCTRVAEPDGGNRPDLFAFGHHITDYLNVIGAVQHPASELEEDAEPKAASPQPDDTSSLTRDAILHALKECRGNKSRAAEYLGVSRKTLYKWMRRLQVLG